MNAATVEALELDRTLYEVTAAYRDALYRLPETAEFLDVRVELINLIGDLDSIFYRANRLRLRAMFATTEAA